MKPSSFKKARWKQTIDRVQKGMTQSEAEQILGAPSNTVSSGPMEILAYQAEQIGGAVYSIRVAFADGRVSQCYMGYELCEGDCRSQAQKRSERFQLFLAVLLAIVVVLIYAWWKNR